MKKKLLIIGVFLMLATYGFSQFEIKTNPIGLLVSKSIPVSAEYVVTDNIGVEATFSYKYGFLVLDDVQGFNGKLLFKYYFGPNMGGDKFYAAPYFNYTNLTGTASDEFEMLSDASYTAIGVGFAIGFKWVAESGFLIDIGAGAGKNFSGGFEIDNPDFTVGNDHDSVFPINVLARLSVGYRFGM